jgi:hypothetical protein
MEMTLMADPKIVQIVPAVRGWHVWWTTKSGSVSDEIACWGLDSDGNVLALIPGDNASLVPAGDEGDLKASIFSPVQSWEFRTTSGAPPTEEDWECIGVATEPDANTLLWRRKRSGA